MRSQLGTIARRLAVGVVLVALGLMPIVGQASPANARPLETGILFVEPFEATALQHVNATGADLVRIGVVWRSIAPAHEPNNWNPEDPGDPHYDWAALDLEVTRAIDAGLTPMLMVYWTPQWAERCESAVPSGICDPDPSALAAFTAAVTRRYSGEFAGLPRVRYWQGLNEPNLSLSFDPQFENGKPVSPDLYRTLINVFYKSVKSVNPSNVVLAAGLGPIAVPNQTIGPMRFTRELLCMAGRHHPHPKPGNCGGGVHFDVFCINPYTTGGPTHRGRADDVELGDLPKLQELIRAADRAKRIKGMYRHTPLWITEFSWDSKPPDPGGVPMGILSRWTAEALYRSWSAGVSRFFWLDLRDPASEPGLPSSETVESGLYFRGPTIAEDRPKPNMYAFRFPFVAYSRKTGFFFWGRTPNSKGGKVEVQIRKGGRWRNASVARADKNGIFEGLVKGAYGRHKHGSVRARYRGEAAPAFSLHPVKDFYQPPFG